MLNAEANRNREIRSEPFDLKDFCFYAEVTEKPMPPSAAGAAMLALLEQELLPDVVTNGPWLQDLATAGKDVTPPSRLCWAAEDAVLLAPWRAGQDQWGGMLIAEASANGATRVFYDEKGSSVVMQIPEDIVPKGAYGASNGEARLTIKNREN